MNKIVIFKNVEDTGHFLKGEGKSGEEAVYVTFVDKAPLFFMYSFIFVHSTAQAPWFLECGCACFQGRCAEWRPTYCPGDRLPARLHFQGHQHGMLLLRSLPGWGLGCETRPASCQRILLQGMKWLLKKGGGSVCVLGGGGSVGGRE